jgi:tellurite resistance protein TerC
VAPGPGIVVAAAGLGILAIEFAWARRWLHRMRRGISDASRHARIRSRG